MPMFRKKPVEIEAIQFNYSQEGIDALRGFCGDKIGRVTKDRHPSAKGKAQIMTLEDGSGDMVAKHIATEGDWIIKGVKGEFYPCKPDIFEETYEAV
jgi:hypothetical protein